MDDFFHRFYERPDSAGIFLDFDGTLSQIVQVPADARPWPGVRDVLEQLAERAALVAIISGRSAHQLLEWLGTGVEIWGVHGAEVVRDGKVVLSERAMPHQSLMRTVLDEAVQRVAAVPIDGIVIEDKGVMIGLHFRAAADVERARTELDEIASDLVAKFGLRRAGGRLAFELRPPVDFTKEGVLLERAREAGLEAAMFMGDDRVDLPAFDALDALAEEGVVTLRAAVWSDEAPPELLERADVVVDGVDEAVQLLRRLVNPQA